MAQNKVIFGLFYLFLDEKARRLLVFVDSRFQATRWLELGISPKQKSAVLADS
jgi:hypothetical protein